MELSRICDLNVCTVVLVVWDGHRNAGKLSCIRVPIRDKAIPPSLSVACSFRSKSHQCVTDRYKAKVAATRIFSIIERERLINRSSEGGKKDIWFVLLVKRRGTKPSSLFVKSRAISKLEITFSQKQLLDKRIISYIRLVALIIYFCFCWSDQAKAFVGCINRNKCCRNHCQNKGICLNSKQKMGATSPTKKSCPMRYRRPCHVTRPSLGQASRTAALFVSFGRESLIWRSSLSTVLRTT